MRGWMVLRPVIGEILGAWAPEYVEVTLLDAVLDPVEAHVDGDVYADGSRCFWTNSAVSPGQVAKAPRLIAAIHVEGTGLKQARWYHTIE